MINRLITIYNRTYKYISEILDKYPNYSFGIVVLVLLIHFRFYETINLPPQATDLWRQSDCYSIALNYYQHGFHFFKPQVHFQFAQQGYAAGEFPIVYFIAAVLFKFFGVHYFLFRGINVIIFLAGIYCLFRLFIKQTQNTIFSLLVITLFFCSPLIFFYANNFMCDTSALSFNIMGLYFFMQFLEQPKKGYLTLSAIFFSLAALLKANAIIFPIAIVGAVIYNVWLAKKKSEYFVVLSTYKITILVSLLLAVIMASSWYLYAIRFNASNGTVFFGTRAMQGWPLWENNWAEIKPTLIYFKNIYYDQALLSNLMLTFLSVVFVVLYFRKIDSFLSTLWILVFIGLLLFAIYFFKGFVEQEYYVVNTVIFPILSMMIAYPLMANIKLSVFIKQSLPLAALFLALLGIYKGKNMYKMYYKKGWRMHKLMAVYYDKGLNDALIRHGIDSNDKVISLTDNTPNGTLVMLNRAGWSGFGFARNSPFLSSDFESKIKMGASYLILNDTLLLQNDVVKKYTQKFIGNYKELYFYSLKE
ncbi:MAG: glycosyltransferase family 39 protein [Bacteroidia bacterium]|nr:glycosyltransferase family 39 protein [Bacteroidia bacterium]MCZ2247212.1 glycosyltransferase family 39 protein [Bacteroidia bacterium]